MMLPQGLFTLGCWGGTGLPGQPRAGVCVAVAQMWNNDICTLRMQHIWKPGAGLGTERD